MDVFLTYLWPTVLLVGTATILMIVIGMYLGIRGGWSRGSRLDRSSMGLSLTFYSTPDFWLAMMLLIIFSTTLGWFPSGGYETPNSGLTGMARIVDQIVQIAPLVGIEHIHGPGYSTVDGRKGRIIHVVAGIFGAQVMSLTEDFTSQLFAQGNPRFHHGAGVDRTVPHCLKALLW